MPPLLQLSDKGSREVGSGAWSSEPGAETEKGAKRLLARSFLLFLVCSLQTALFDYNKLWFACADHPLRVGKPVHVNGDPAAVHEHEVRVPDQAEMTLAVSLDEEFLRMPPKTEHFAVTRPELLLVHSRLLIHVRLALASGRGSPARFHFRRLTRILH